MYVTNKKKQFDIKALILRRSGVLKSYSKGCDIMDHNSFVPLISCGLNRLSLDWAQMLDPVLLMGTKHQRFIRGLVFSHDC